jgi:hypothetical protein
MENVRLRDKETGRDGDKDYSNVEVKEYRGNGVLEQLAVAVSP